jgi:hypothetical protein
MTTKKAKKATSLEAELRKSLKAKANARAAIAGKGMVPVAAEPPKKKGPKAAEPTKVKPKFADVEFGARYLFVVPRKDAERVCGREDIHTYDTGPDYIVLTGRVCGRTANELTFDFGLADSHDITGYVREREDVFPVGKPKAASKRAAERADVDRETRERNGASNERREANRCLARMVAGSKNESSVTTFIADAKRGQLVTLAAILGIENPVESLGDVDVAGEVLVKRYRAIKKAAGEDWKSLVAGRREAIARFTELSGGHPDWADVKPGMAAVPVPRRESSQAA